MHEQSRAAILLWLVLVPVSLGACGTAPAVANPASPPGGQTLEFENGWNFVALGPLDAQAAQTVVSACQTSFRPVNNPNEPRAWVQGCEAAGAAIARLGSES